MIRSHFLTYLLCVRGQRMIARHGAPSRDGFLARLRRNRLATSIHVQLLYILHLIG